MTHKEFLLLKNKLIQLVTPFGVSVRISKKPICRPNLMGVSGTYSSARRKINVTSRGNNSYLSILATLAHEVRHAQHHHLGLYAEYYNPLFEDKNYRSQIKQGLIAPPSVQVGQEAEDDCNLFARTWLEAEGYPLDSTKKTYESYFNPYPVYNVLSYYLNQLAPLPVNREVNGV